MSFRKLSNQITVTKEKYQMMSVIDETIPDFQYQLILVYLSSNCPMSQVVDDLSHLLNPKMRTIITGDFNFDKKEVNAMTVFLKAKMFTQVVTWPTHSQGRTIDHCYVSDNTKVSLTRHSPYYSDHSALCIEFDYE